jgi:hypothetical protein
MIARIMRIHDEIRRTIASGLDETTLLNITTRLAKVHGNGETARPIVLYTILTVLEGTWRLWFGGYPTTVELAATLTARLVPSVNALLHADERGQADEILAALDDLATAYRRSVNEFRT